MNTFPPNYQELTQSVSKNLATLRTDIPDVMKGFGDLAKAATRDGALDKKTKELIALALGVAAHCDACIGFHTKALVQLGARPAAAHLQILVYFQPLESLVPAHPLR